MVLSIQHYSVIDGSEGEVLVGIYHNNITSHLYISDSTGTSYSLSLDYIVQSGGENGNPTFDVHLVSISACKMAYPLYLLIDHKLSLERPIFLCIL